MIRIAPFRTCTRGGRAVNREFEHTTANRDSQEFVVLRRGVGGSNVFTDPPIVNQTATKRGGRVEEGRGCAAAPAGN